MKNILFYLILLGSTLFTVNVLAEQESDSISEAELAQILAPIALYPDSLLTHILIASTYPIDVVEAYRWADNNDNLTAEQRTKELEDYTWDASVKALIPFEHVLSQLNEDIRWTQALGDAFLYDEEGVLQSIQALRKQAKLAGNLSKMDNMDVSYEAQNIIIAPKEKEVVYVPYYDSRMVYGTWAWASFPPVYWQNRHNAYVSHYSPFYWNTGVRIRFNYFFSAFHWHNRYIVIGNNKSTNHRFYHQRPRRLIAHGGYAKRWSHKRVNKKAVIKRPKKFSHYRAKHTNKHSAKHVVKHRTKKNHSASVKSWKKVKSQKVVKHKANKHKITRTNHKSSTSKLSHKKQQREKSKGGQRVLHKKKKTKVQPNSPAKQFASKQKSVSKKTPRTAKAPKSSKPTKKEKLKASNRSSSSVKRNKQSHIARASYDKKQTKK